MSSKPNLEETLSKLEESIKKFGQETKTTQLIESARALSEIAYDLVQLGQEEQALKALEQIIDRFSQATEIPLLEPFANALLNKGVTLGQLGRLEEALKAFEQIIDRFSQAFETPLLEQSAKALVNKGITLGKLGRLEEELKAYEQIIDRFNQANETALLETFVDALLSKGVTLGKLGRAEEELKAYEQIIDRFSQATETPLIEQFAKTLVNKGATLSQLGRLEEALKAFEQIIDRFSKATETPLIEQFAKALVNKGFTLGQLGRLEEALKALEQIIDRFRQSTEPQFVKSYASALVNKGYVFVRIGKYLEAIELFDEVISRTSDTEALSFQGLKSIALSNKAEALVKLNYLNDAIIVCDQVITNFGESIADRNTKLAVIEAWLTKGKAIETLSISNDSQEMLAMNIEEIKQCYQKALEIEPNNMDAKFALALVGVPEHLQEVVRTVIEKMSNKKDTYFSKMAEAGKRTDDFLSNESRLTEEFPFFLSLRRWNSYTPVIPSTDEATRGGGYYLRVFNSSISKWQGLVIDPGYNFIENFWSAGGRIVDIDFIIITHAHNDHTIDFESLCTLLHQFNKKNVRNIKKKEVTIYFNAGSFIKFSGLLDIKSSDKFSFIKKLILINPEDTYEIWPGLKMYIQPAYHDEVITPDRAVGLLLEINSDCFGPSYLKSSENIEKRSMFFTGDTSLFPVKKDESGKILEKEGHLVVNLKEEQAIYNKYHPRGLFESFRYGRPSLDLAIVHLGSIYSTELDEHSEDAAKRFYPNHLGVMGSSILINNLWPRLALLSEFGEELLSLRIELAEGINEVVKKSTPPTPRSTLLSSDKPLPPPKPPVVLPADLSFCYHIVDRAIYCVNTKKFEPVDQVSCISQDNYLYYQKADGSGFDHSNVVKEFKLGLPCGEVTMSRRLTAAPPPYIKKRDCSDK